MYVYIYIYVCIYIYVYILLLLSLLLLSLLLLYISISIYYYIYIYYFIIYILLYNKYIYIYILFLYYIYYLCIYYLCIQFSFFSCKQISWSFWVGMQGDIYSLLPVHFNWSDYSSGGLQLASWGAQPPCHSRRLNMALVVAEPAEMEQVGCPWIEFLLHESVM